MKTGFAIFLFFCYCSLHAQQKDTISIKQTPHLFTAFENAKEIKTRIKSLVLPATFIGYGFLSLVSNGVKTIDKNTKIELREDHPHFASKIDNYLQYPSVIAVYGLNAFGIKGKNCLPDCGVFFMPFR